MKAWIVSTTALLGALLSSCERQEVQADQSSPTDHPHQTDPPTTVEKDPTEIFQKAFWKRPTADDKIHHAERREWSDSEGVQRWQWFIVVEPSAALLKHLREDNAFSLTPAASFLTTAEAPPWFKLSPGEFELLHDPHGNMRLYFSKSRPLLLATDSGGGFYPAVTPTEKPVPTGQQPTGRIPLSPAPAEREPETH
jgi:hypothetical protein